LFQTAVIFGAGKTGRGFAAHLAFLGGYEIILVDNNKQLVDDLVQAGQYDIEVLSNADKNVTVPVSAAYNIDDSSWHEPFVKTSLVFTAVFGNNLPALAAPIATALQKRKAENSGQLLTIITCENLTNAAGFLKNAVNKHLAVNDVQWLATHVGFSESIIFRTCLEANANQHPLTIRAQNFFELPCDAEGIKEELHVYGLKPLRNFSNQLRRKIYTYNCINAVITYLGAEKGYTQLYEAGNDPVILEIAKQAATETCLAQVAEFGFDENEQEDWMNAAFAKFADTNVPDPIERNGADPARKLGRDDRLIGPALLALKHGIYPGGLLAGIKACFNYHDVATPYTINSMVTEKGADFVLNDICGLSAEEELFMLIKNQIEKSNPDGK
jgi:mannitol-1-phosphate 5-dehydrogenase